MATNHEKMINSTNYQKIQIKTILSYHVYLFYGTNFERLIITMVSKNVEKLLLIYFY